MDSKNCSIVNMKNLFKSQTSYEVLGLLTRESGQQYYLAELAKTLGKDTANLVRELAKLEQDGLVTTREQGGKRFYSFNSAYPAAEELRALLAKERTLAFEKKFSSDWMLGADEPSVGSLLSKLWLDSLTDSHANIAGEAYSKTAAIYRGYHMQFYCDAKDAYEIGENLVNRFERDLGFMEKINEESYKVSDELRGFARTIPETDLNKLSPAQLLKWYEQHAEAHKRYYYWSWLPYAADLLQHNLTGRGQLRLRELGVKEALVYEYLETLIQPTEPTLIDIERDGLMQIAIQVQQDKKQLHLFQELFRKFKEEDVKNSLMIR